MYFIVKIQTSIICIRNICVNNFLSFFFYSSEYKSPDPPRIILDKLELKGYKVLAMSGIGQTCVWTLHKPPEFLAS